MPGGVATASLVAKVMTPAALSMTVAPNAQFGDVVLNDIADSNVRRDERRDPTLGAPRDQLWALVTSRCRAASQPTA